MNDDEYIINRVDDQINWYNSKSQWNKKGYYLVRSIEFIAAAIIPLLIGYVTEESVYIKFSIGFLGCIIISITGINSLFSFQENWIKYRTTCESLKSEKHFFLTKTSPYDNEESFSSFVLRIESLISKENKDWSQCMATERRRKENG